MSYPKPISGGTKDPLPAAILVPRSGIVYVRHYHGNSSRTDFNRLWITAPARHAQELTDGVAVAAWPGDEIGLYMDAGEELRLAINGGETLGVGIANPGATFDNLSDQARVHEVTDYPDDVVTWARYVEWEDLDRSMVPSSEYIYNDSRTLVYYAGRRPTLGGLGFGVR